MVAPGASWMPIGELSRRVGVSSDLLRKWERRYGLLAPVRTHGNQRLYSQVDEARLRLMLRHVGEGVPAAQAAELASAARFRISVTPQPTARRGQAEADRAEMLAALERFDETMAEQVLDKLLATRGVITVIQDVVLPLLGDLGERWASAQVNVAQEHFISAFIHGRLLGLARGWDRGLGQRALLACPQNEHHTFGLISFGIALHRLGWRITYLGADTPAAQRHTGKRAASATSGGHLHFHAGAVGARSQRAEDARRAGTRGLGRRRGRSPIRRGLWSAPSGQRSGDCSVDPIGLGDVCPSSVQVWMFTGKLSG